MSGPAASGTGRLRLLILVGYYLPGYKSGGPTRTLSNLAAHLGGEFDLRVLTRDRDALDAGPYPGIVADAWTRAGQAQVYYLSPGPGLLARIARVMGSTPHDLLYLNSLFDPVFTGWPLLLRRLGRDRGAPVLVAPRGECASPALALSRWKKAPYRRLFRALGLCRDITWQASTPVEAEAIRGLLDPPTGRILVAPNLAAPVAAAAADLAWPPRRGPLRVVFLARVAPMKNLTFALEVLAQVRVPLSLTIHGPLNDLDYWRRCQDLMARLPSQIQVHYGGPVPHDQVAATLAQHDLFLLPTLGENFGHGILEALGAGTPVLISDTTPWRGLAGHGVGWDLPLSTKDPWVACLHQAAGRDAADYAAWRTRVLAYARAWLADPEPLRAARSLLYQAAGRPCEGQHG